MKMMSFGRTSDESWAISYVTKVRLLRYFHDMALMRMIRETEYE